MRCPTCAADNPEGSKFCSACGGEINLKPLPVPDQGEEGAAGADVAAGREGAEPYSPFPTDVDPAVFGGEAAAGDQPQGQGQTVFKDVELCTVCSGAFPIGDLIEFDGKLYCALCKAREVKEAKGGQVRAAAFQEELGGMYEHDAAPGTDQEYRPEEPEEEDINVYMQPPPERREGGSKPSSRMKVAEPVSSGTYVLFIGGIGFLVVGLVVIVVVFLVIEPAGKTSEGGSAPAPPPVKKVAEPEVPDEPEPPDEPPPPPKKPEKIISYQPRWFTGTYLGLNKDIENVPKDCLIFVSDNNQNVFIKGLPDLYHVGKKYRFRFKPQKRFFTDRVILFKNILVSPQPPEDFSTGSGTTPREKRPQYPRKNVIIYLNDHSQYQGDILGDDGENYIIRLRDGSGEIRISKNKVVKID
jgi:hypothetical protein